MKTAISIPDDDFTVIERAVRAAGVSRSEFFRRGALRLAAELDEQRFVDAVNDALENAGPQAAEEAALVADHGRRTLAELSEW